ncbi:MAG: methyltransferase domain-containing protein [Acidobacteria bacterium]|nr:MAG: methyltransferase domain-containing protein [Acidobacteriota bacterium]
MVREVSGPLNAMVETNPSSSLHPAIEDVRPDRAFARRFRRRTGLDLVTVIERILAEADLRPGDRVLDIASSDATLALQMVARVHPGQVTCLCPIGEILGEAYEQARAAGLEESIDWRIAAIEELPFPDQTFDVLTCSSSFRLLDGRAFIAEAHRVLSSGGRLLIAESTIPHTRLNEWRLAWRAFYHQYVRKDQAEAAAEFYSVDELAEMLVDAGFQPVVIRGLQRPWTVHSWIFSLIKAIKP